MSYHEGSYFPEPDSHPAFVLGAIMFNDTLTMDQCKALIVRLSETALPFQCAHGR